MNKNILQHKISKYSYKYITNTNQNKKSLYTEKLYGYMKGGYDYTNAQDVLRYLDCRINNTDCLRNEKGIKLESNEQPYLLVVYGPPASGKSYAKDLMIKEFGLSNNYVYIDVDQMVYDTDQFQHFKNTVDVSDLVNINSDDIDTHPKIQMMIETYRKIRSKTNFLLRIFLGIALMFNYNIVLETPGGGSDWFNIAEELLNNKYDIYLVYPFTNNIEMLVQRSIKRGLAEHRFVQKKYLYDMARRSQKNFLRVLDPLNISKFRAIYVYETKPNEFVLSDNNLLFAYVNPKENQNQNYLSDEKYLHLVDILKSI
ncbi:hypothetical protein QJ857_gp0213 [Tupanvirus soda lake]|uniref:Zeta toxin domain-containing protein n=2 Tax=Tupanvirus TaxID=2094720 RepID=A0A6N1P4C9_9VIRU|nr:hypothetical protein QJ857_gp0213 [Tupanvirus soda lake]QKU35811.1 hypothetical protein [Tupanvirus soda lake]